jgi:hypothetical protein
MFRKEFTALLLAVVSAAPCPAQSRPSFEVATIRPSNGNPNEGFWSPPGSGRFTAHNLTLAR